MRAKTRRPLKRATDTTLAKRVEEVLFCRLNGAELHDLRAHAAERKWNVSDRQLRRYIEAADTLLAETMEADREKLMTRHLAKRRALYARAVMDGDHRTALAVLRDEAELLGLYPAAKLNVNTDPIVTVVGGIDLDVIIGRKPGITHSGVGRPIEALPLTGAGALPEAHDDE